MKKILIFCIALFSLVAFSISVSAATRNVSTTAQLRTALDACQPGDEIVLSSGTYLVDRPLILDGKKNITIRSASGNSQDTIIKGTSFHKVDSQRTTDVLRPPDEKNEGDELLWIYSSSNITIKGIKFHWASCHGIKFNTPDGTGILNITIENCHFLDINERMLKGTRSDGHYLEGLKIINNTFENTQIPVAEDHDPEFGGDYVGGMDLMHVKGALVSGNTFKNIRGPLEGARGGIFMWHGSENVTVEKNTFIGCDRSICFGNGTGAVGAHMKNSIIRNNIVMMGKDIGIELACVSNVKVYNNTVCQSTANGRGIILGASGNEYIDIKNNYLHGRNHYSGSVISNMNSTCVESNNLFRSGNSIPAYFENGAEGDFHLKSSAANLIGKGVPLSDVATDFDGVSRETPPSIGAFEYVSPTCKLSGTVSFAGKLLPIVTITGPDGVRPVTIAANGSYEVSVIEGVSYTIKATKARHLPFSASVSILADDTCQIKMLVGNIVDNPASDKYVIDIDDLIVLLGSYKATTGSTKYNANADLNESGTIDIDDLILLLGNYKKSAVKA